MGRLIDADLLKEKAVKFSFSTNKWVSDVDIDLMPTVDAVPVVRGKWILGGYDDLYWLCSVCEHKRSEYYAEPKDNFCPNCGAKMDNLKNKYNE